MTTVTNKKSKGKAKTFSCNVVCASSREDETYVTSLTDSEGGKIVLVVEQSAPLVAGTRSGQQYLKKYDEMVPSSSKPTKEAAKQSTKQPVEKQKELRYNKALLKDNVKRPSTLFCFNVLAQLVNIPAEITFYELLRLSKSGKLLKKH